MVAVLVAGGAGYIGSHTCKVLKQKGFVPVVYDNLQNGHKWAANYGPLIIGDLLDEAKLDQLFKTYQPKAVLHFASSIHVRESMQNPGSYYQNNVMGSLSLLRAMEKNRVNFLVFSSSAAVYGMPQRQLLSESDLCHPINVYGTTKWMVEKMIHDFERAHGMRSVILRYFNAAGADRDGELGEAHTPETHLIPLAIQVALGKRDRLDVFGSDHATPDGTAVRDYVHVTDLAQAHIQAVEWLLSGNDSMTFNLGTGKGHSLNEVLTLVEKISGGRLSKQILPRNQNEPPILVANPEKAMNFLKWRPIYSDLETIISTAYEWHRGT